jgi:peptidoglycan/LPS O-acetylase OafA/YrhL
LAGTVVHLFFILSGCGLTVSYFRKGSVSWREWAKRRFRKIGVPYLIIDDG